MQKSSQHTPIIRVALASFICASLLGETHPAKMVQTETPAEVVKTGE